MLGSVSCFQCRLLTFFAKLTFSQKIENTIRFSKGLDPDQDQRYVGPDLGPNCLERK